MPDDDFHMAYNQKRVELAERCGRKNATDAAIGRLLGVSASCATKWRRGERAPHQGVMTAILEKMANAQLNQ